MNARIFKKVAVQLGIDPPRNYGDLIYSFRYRSLLPEAIRKTAPSNKEWIIEGAGDGKYKFILVDKNRITPSLSIASINILDNTPKIITKYLSSDEQALLTKIRYNRLIDLFLGQTCYSLQNHLRTKVADIGQIEIDEVYIGIDSNGKEYIIPVQAKCGTDNLSVVQTKQDIAYCEKRYPKLICKPVSAHFISAEKIALFEFSVQDNIIKIERELHYTLVN